MDKSTAELAIADLKQMVEEGPSGDIWNGFVTHASCMTLRHMIQTIVYSKANLTDAKIVSGEDYNNFVTKEMVDTTDIILQSFSKAAVQQFEVRLDLIREMMADEEYAPTFGDNGDELVEIVRENYEKSLDLFVTDIIRPSLINDNSETVKAYTELKTKGPTIQ